MTALLDKSGSELQKVADEFKSAVTKTLFHAFYFKCSSQTGRITN